MKTCLGRWTSQIIKCRRNGEKYHFKPSRWRCWFSTQGSGEALSATKPPGMKSWGSGRQKKPDEELDNWAPGNKVAPEGARRLERLSRSCPSKFVCFAQPQRSAQQKPLSPCTNLPLFPLLTEALGGLRSRKVCSGEDLK